MKKFLFYILSVCMIAIFVVTPVSVLADDIPIDMTEYKTGDINDDGALNLYDLITIAQAQAKWTNVNFVFDACDTDGNGNFELDDVTYLARYFAGWANINLH